MKTALGMAVRSLRQRAGYSQEQLALAAGINRAHLSKVENGEADPKFSTVVNLAKAMHFSLANLIEEFEHYLPNLQPAIEMLSDGILKYTKIGRLDASNNMQLVEDVFGLAISKDIHRVLVNLENAAVFFSDQEQYFQVRQAVGWLKERSYWPIAIAVVSDAPLLEFGISVARHDYGLNIQIFPNVPEGLKWLRNHSTQSANFQT